MSRNPGQKGTSKNIALFFGKITINVGPGFNFWTLSNLSFFSFAQRFVLLRKTKLSLLPCPFYCQVWLSEEVTFALRISYGTCKRVSVHFSFIFPEKMTREGPLRPLQLMHISFWKSLISITIIVPIVQKSLPGIPV